MYIHCMCFFVCEVSWIGLWRCLEVCPACICFWIVSDCRVVCHRASLMWVLLEKVGGVGFSLWILYMCECIFASFFS